MTNVACQKICIMLSFILVDLKSIIFLLEFMEPPSVVNHQCTIDLENIIRAEIRINHGLKSKIHEYLYDLSVTNHYLDSLRIILNFIPHSSIVSDFNRHRFLLNSLKSNTSQSSDFYVAWFLCFLTDVNYSMNSENEQKEYEELIKTWMSSFCYNEPQLCVMMMKVDKLLEPFRSVQTGSDHEKCCKILVHHLVNVCFKQGKIYKT